MFKYPDNATMNYIKRLVGLPGETISIHDGDLWIHEPDKPEGHFEIARKPPEKILAMLQPVYDNDLAPTITGELHWPARWTAEPGPADNAWTNGKTRTRRTYPRSRSKAAARARPGFVTGIGCLRPNNGRVATVADKRRSWTDTDDGSKSLSAEQAPRTACRRN